MDQPQKYESIKSPISVPVSPANAVKCYPCREVPLNYSDSLLFHSRDTSSIPIVGTFLINTVPLIVSPRVAKVEHHLSLTVTPAVVG